jgi:CheY-like chemotaxis protein
VNDAAEGGAEDGAGGPTPDAGAAAATGAGGTAADGADGGRPAGRAPAEAPNAPGALDGGADVDDAAPPLRLLVVDDDAVDRMAVRRALRQAGISATVSEAADGAEAVAAVRAAVRADAAGPGGAGAALDCVLLDYQLPDATGLDVLRRLRSDAATTDSAAGAPSGAPTAAGLPVPVVMLTGPERPRDGGGAHQGRASDFIPKGALTARPAWCG